MKKKRLNMDKIIELQKEFAQSKDELVKKYKHITSMEAVFDVIDLVLGKFFKNGESESVSVTEDVHAKFIYLDDILIALVEYLYINDMPVLFLNFHVATIPNTAIRVYQLIKEEVDIPVISTHVFYPVADKNGSGGNHRILYDQEAVMAYGESLSERIYKERRVIEEEWKNIKRSDDYQLN